MHAKRLNCFALLGVLGGLGLAACGEKEAEVEGAPAEEKGVAANVPEEALPVPTASPEARAEALGYARYLPKDTQGFLSVYDGKGFAESLRGSKLGVFVEEQAAEAGMNLDDLAQDPNAGMVLSLLSEEFFVAVGKGAGTQTNNLVRFQQSMNRQQFKMLVQMFDAQLGGEGMAPGDEAMFAGVVKELLEDPKAGTNVLESAQMPPLTIGVKVSDAEQREGLLGMISGAMADLLSEIGPDGAGFAEALEAQRGEAAFTGIRIDGAKLMKALEEREKEQMVQQFGAANVERLLAIGATKNLVFAVGSHHDYVVLFAGTDIEELQVVENLEDSYVANTDLAFTDAYLDKKLLAVSSTSKDLMQGIAKDSTMLASIAQGIKAGLAETENLGDTRDMEVLLDLLIKQEAELMGMVSYRAGGMAAFREEGLKIEVFGPTDGGNMDLASPRKFASLGERDGVFLFSNAVNNKAYMEKSLEYLDTLGEIAYLGASRAAVMDIGDPDFKEGFELFETQLKPDLITLWKALREDLAAGLGSEGAVLVDLKGGLPTAPMLPQVIVDEGRAPRIAIIQPVEDREKLGASWTSINSAAENLLKTVSELTEQNIPMQKPMSSEKDDLTTWFFASIPFQTDDFVLSISVDEQNFYASTSKSFVQELSAALADESAAPGKPGAYLEVDFQVLQAYLADWVELVDKHAEELFGGPDAAEGFRGELPRIRELLAALDELQSLTSRTRLEGGVLRSSIHFKVQ